MKQVENITVSQLSEMAKKMYGGLVKAVVDIEKKIVVVDAEMHVDEEQFLLEQGSKQANLWGINLYPQKYGGEDFIEFDSMINIRPSANNMSRYINDATIRGKIINLINETVNND